MPFARAAPYLAVVAALSAAAGLLYSILSHGVPLAGLVYGCSIGLTVMLFERRLVLAALQDRIRRWPSLLYIPALEAAFIALICIGFLIGGLISWALHITRDPFFEAVVPTPHALVYSIGVSVAIVFVTRVRDLLGRDVFINFLVGRYHRPVEEERIFLFIDLVGSTGYARTHGDLRAQAFLGAIFAGLAEPVRAHGGAIDDYVGDMALVTWPLRRGLRNADCVRCIFAVFEVFERDAVGWKRRFGQRPQFRAALHGGRVVTAEVGVDRHKISYFGDVVNTTARLERLCRDLDAPILVSGDLLARIAVLPNGVEPRSFGFHALKGIDARVEAFALERSPDVSASPLDRGRRPLRSAVIAARG